MNSITKRRLSADDLDRVVKRAFGEDTAVTAHDYDNAGWFNTIYILQLNNGEKVVLKVFPSPEVRLMRYERGIMSVEVEIMRRLREDGVLPVPEILFHSKGAEILGSEFYLMRALEGRPYGEAREGFSQEQQSRIDFEAGRYCRRLNEIKGERFGLYTDKAKQRATWAEAFGMLLSDLLQDAADRDVELPMENQAIFDMVMAAPERFDEVTVPSLIHWDLHDGNLFVDSDGQITGILDFERSLWADPLMEFNFGVHCYRDDFNRGYGFLGNLTASERFRRASYDLYLALVMAIECFYRGFDDEKHIEWTRRTLNRELDSLMALAS